MAYEGHAVVGSGIKPQLQGIPTNPITGERHQQGTNVVLVNPEDGSAGGPFKTTAVSITAVATRLPTDPLKYRRAIAIRNNGGNTIYIGEDATVTIGTGFPLKTDEIFESDVTGTGELWAIAASATDVRVIELA